MFLGELGRFDGVLTFGRAHSFPNEMIGFYAVSAFFQGGTHPLKSIQSRAVLGLHAEGGFGEESAAIRSNFIDGAGFAD